MTHLCLLDYKQPRVRGLWVTRQDNGHEEVLIITIGEQLVLAQCVVHVYDLLRSPCLHVLFYFLIDQPPVWRNITRVCIVM
jgi:hypothetical protein